MPVQGLGYFYRRVNPRSLSGPEFIRVNLAKRGEKWEMVSHRRRPAHSSKSCHVIGMFSSTSPSDDELPPSANSLPLKIFTEEV